METPNTEAMTAWLERLGMDAAAIRRVYATFNAGAPAFQKAGERHGG
jgi:hypothetical protein